jgi:DNA transposition AAA+ family ATPase
MATAPEKFRAFLDENRVLQTDAADSLGVSDPTVHDWLTGAKKPRLAWRKAIAKFTRNAVRVEDWEDESERQIVAAVRPFRRPAPKPAA